MTIDDFVYYLLLKQEWDSFQKNLQKRIKNKQDIINKKLAEMNKLAKDIRVELGLEAQE